MSTFKALQISKVEDQNIASVVQLHEADLPPGDVTVDVLYSDLNYKDGLTIQPKSALPQVYPLVPGIDLAGIVNRSEDPRFTAGDRVLVNGFGIGTDRDGGLTQKTRVPADLIVPIPDGLDAWSAAALGTAGYTSALAVLALQRLGVAPASGPVLVTGSSGGAGIIAVFILAKLGFEVVASTGRRAEQEFLLRELGAHEVIDRIGEQQRPGLSKQRWAGVVDTVGSRTLVNALASTKYGGSVACMGMAQGLDLPASMHPFILRSITLAGIDSVHAPMQERLAAWRLLADCVETQVLQSFTETIALADATQAALDLLAGKLWGRRVVDVNL